MTISQTAMTFFENCETGKGWDTCKASCHENATFSCQSAALAEVGDIATYTEWMKGLLTPIPDGYYELTAFATDNDRSGMLIIHCRL